MKLRKGGAAVALKPNRTCRLMSTNYVPTPSSEEDDSPLAGPNTRKRLMMDPPSGRSELEQVAQEPGDEGTLPQLGAGKWRSGIPPLQ